ncbi:MAG: autotransporter-associated beta strand repeat-containing protein, partial [Gammaproteobacteria bacterium]|nr:autotransporter-associated beta strand repeat-containing protein [Gammaproteobacteria bacterium]
VLTISGGTSGTADLIKSGAGSLALSGANTYVGTTTVNGGVLRAHSANAFNSTSAFTVGASGTLRLNGFSQTVLSLEGAAGAILENGAASGNVILTLGDSTSTTFAGTIQNGAAATLGLTKVGNGALTLSGTNTYTGSTTVNAGVLNITGSLTGNNTTTSLIYGNTAGNTIVNVSGNINAFVTTGANVAGSVAVFNQTAGTVTIVPTNGTDTQWVARTGYGYLNITGGTFNTGRFDVNAPVDAAVGVVYVGGTGTLNQNVGDYFIVAYRGLAQLTVGPGGTLTRQSTVTAGLHITMNGSNSSGTLNIAGGNVDAGPSRGLTFGFSTPGTGNMGFVNLAGGVLSLGANTTFTGAGASSTSEFFNFSGGTIKANAALSNVIPASNANHTATSTLFGAIINNNNADSAFNTQVGTTSNFAGGLTVDTNNFAVTFSNPLLGATGYAVTQANITIPASGNSGYIGTPAVQFSAPAGGGVPASGYALISGGQVTGIVITSPGTYALNETPTITLTGGGGSIAAFNATALTTVNSDAGLTKIGAGTLTLSGSNTYTGGTTITNGTLALGANDVLADTGSVTVNGGTLDVNTRAETVATVALLSGAITGSTGVLNSSADFDLRSGMVNFTSTGGLAGSGNVTKTTLGTVTLLDNGLGTTFTQAVNINGGTLEFSNANQFGSATGIGIGIATAGGTLSLVTPTTANVTQAVTIGSQGATLNTNFAVGALNLTSGITTSTSAALTKTGPGTVTVTGTTNLNGGVVTVSGGTLNAGFSASGISGVTVANGGALNLYDGSAVTAAITSLSLANGSALGFDLNAPGTNDVLALTTNAPVLSGTITVNLNNLGSLGVGTYDLITSALGGLNGASYTLGTAPSGPNYSFATVSGDSILRLTVSALTLRYWQGDQDGSWSTNNSGNTNWSTDENGVTDVGALPASTDTLVFSATNAQFTTGSVINTTLDGSRMADSLRFLGAPAGVTAFTIAPGSGGTLTLVPVSSNNGISVADNAGAVTISAQIATGAAQTWEVIGTGANGSSLTISGGVTFNNSVTKTGAGALTLSGSNSEAGGLTINAGTLNLGSATAPGTGTLTLGPGIVLDNTSGAPLTLTNNNAVVVNGSFSFTGTNALDLGTGALTLGVNAILEIVNSQLVVGGIAGDGGNVRELGKAGAGTLVLNGANTYDGLTSLLQGTLTLAGDNSAAGGGVTTSAGTTLNINNNNALGSGTLTISSGSTIDNTLGSLVTNAGNNLQVWNGSFTFTGTDSLNLGTGAVTLGNSLTATISASTLTVGGVIDDGASTFNLTKLGNGTLALNGQSTYNGTTIIQAGTVILGVNDALPTGTVLTVGASTTAGTLDLNGFNQTIGSLLVQTNNNAVTNHIIVDAANTLTVNGAVTIGVNANESDTNLNASGGGAIVVNSGNANFQVGGATGGTNENRVDVDFSGLASFTANLGTGTFRLGDNNTGSGNSTSTFKLATNNVITAASIRIGDGTGGGQVHTLTLGSGTNDLNANTINIGSAGATIRSSGSMIFDAGDTTGTVTIRAADGTNRATINMVNTTGDTATDITSAINLTGHTADILASTLTMASRTVSANAATATLSFDQGTLDATTLIMARRTSTGTGSATATLNIGGGTAIFGSTTMAVNTSAGGTVTSTLNVSGGTVT